tara:strand:+ start:340 stop:747 length:408 start_codon:yes stop_codon:yes gene_type:complete
MFKLSKTSRTRINCIEPILIDIIEEAIQTSPVDFGIPRDGGLRTADRQAALFAQGRTTPGAIITYTDGVNKKSYHQSGKAFDIYAYVDGKASWKVSHLRVIAVHIKAVAWYKFGIKLTWGGSWKRFKDYPHFQLD